MDFKKLNKHFYQKAIKQYGISAQGVHWNNKFTQYKRFEILTKFIKKDITSSTIIDAGCGFGEYYNYLNSINKLPKKYIGYDIEENMISISKKRFGFLEFYQKDILNDSLEVVDYYICSGAMNIMQKDDMFLFIKRCFEHSKRGFIFNMLKTQTFNKIKVEEVIKYSKTFTTNIKTKDGYLKNDISLLLLK